MTTRINSFRMAAVAGAIVCLGFARSGLAVDIVDDPAQIDERAAQVVQSANSLCWEIYRYHQQQPDYAPTYRTAKDLWGQAGALRDALQNGPLETEALVQQVAQMNDLLARVDAALSKWGDGDRSMLAMNGRSNPRTVITNGVVVDLPLIGVQVGSPRVAVVDDGFPPIQRRRLHPNSRGSKRSLERELAAVKVAMSYLQEDTGVTSSPNPAPNPPAPGATQGPPVPNPPQETEAKLSEPVKVLPRGAK